LEVGVEAAAASVQGWIGLCDGVAFRAKPEGRADREGSLSGRESGSLLVGSQPQIVSTTM
jgi:hypothetical protein